MMKPNYKRTQNYFDFLNVGLSGGVSVGVTIIDRLALLFEVNFLKGRGEIPTTLESTSTTA